MRIAIALVFGFMTAGMVLFLWRLAFGDPSVVLSIALPLAGLAGATYWIARDARRVSDVLKRGFLLGATLWFCVSLAGIIAETRQAEEATGMFALVSGTVGIGGALFCLLGYGIVRLMSKEGQQPTDSQMKVCPMCAEKIQRAARVCRFCGHSFAEDIPPQLTA